MNRGHVAQDALWNRVRQPATGTQGQPTHEHCHNELILHVADLSAVALDTLSSAS